MGAMPVIAVKPNGQFGGALLGCVVGSCVGPLAQAGLNEALGLSVGLWRVGFGSQMLDSLGNSVGTVSTITNDSTLTLSANAAVDVPKRSFQRNGLVYDDYVVGDFAQGGVANPGTTFADAKTALLTEIAAEKFIALISQYESFSELRRLAVTPAPVVSLGITINNGSKFPTRFIYPQNEINTNPNVPLVSGSVPNQFTPMPIFQ